MKSIFLLFVFLLSALNCNAQSDKELLFESLNKLTSNTQDIGHSYYDDNYLFVKNKDSVIVTNAFKIKGIYYSESLLKDKDSLTLKEFIEKVLAGEIEVPCQYRIGSFFIDNEIKTEYLQLGFERFKNNYVEIFLSDNRVILSTNGLKSENELYSVIYYFYLNGFFTFWADYEGGYFSVKIIEEEIPLSDSLDIILEEM
ncbi:hypothetical protein ACYSNM_08550 [Myroides sp. LJL116]